MLKLCVHGCVPSGDQMHPGSDALLRAAHTACSAVSVGAPVGGGWGVMLDKLVMLCDGEGQA